MKEKPMGEKPMLFFQGFLGHEGLRRIIASTPENIPNEDFVNREMFIGANSSARSIPAATEQNPKKQQEVVWLEAKRERERTWNRPNQIGPNGLRKR